MLCYAPEVLICRQHREIMADAQLGQQRIDRAHLHASSPAAIPQFRRLDMIVAIRHQQGDRRKTVQKLIAALWSCEALKEFLQHKAGRQKSLAAFKSLDERFDLRARRR